ncbi:hypothetical protein NE237_031729 [Protea cynaroides]|uniref:Uncharacterized protein n=1 Tax=Protea cynaroides TaxID=273540 RepID=A0A9Q0R2S8_9MAGN|nr:hypothetical protein NE237_031729 [Protea cynaroides]
MSLSTRGFLGSGYCLLFFEVDVSKVIIVDEVLFFSRNPRGLNVCLIVKLPSQLFECLPDRQFSIEYRNYGKMLTKPFLNVCKFILPVIDFCFRAGHRLHTSWYFYLKAQKLAHIAAPLLAVIGMMEQLQLVNIGELDWGMGNFLCLQLSNELELLWHIFPLRSNYALAILFVAKLVSETNDRMLEQIQVAINSGP